MKEVKMIDHQDARTIIESIIHYVNEVEPLKMGHNIKPDEFAPVVVAVVNPFGAEPRQDVMDGALRVSSDGMALGKAYTAANTGEDGDHWDRVGGPVPKSNDFRYTPTSGGAVLTPPESEQVVGGVGISGRAPERENGGHHPLQDHELAILAREIFIEYTKARKRDSSIKFNEDLYIGLRGRLDI